MKIQTKDMMRYGKVGMSALKFGKKANKLNKLKKRIPTISKEKRRKQKEKVAVWNRRKEMVKKFLYRTQKVAKGSWKATHWLWKRYL